MKVAYLNNDGTIGAIGRIGDNAVLNEKMIQIDENFDTTNKKWNGSDWESYTPEPVPEPEPSQLDRIEANTQSLMSSNSALDVLLGVSE